MELVKNDLIDKLGITPIEITEFNYNITKDPVYICRKRKVRELEQQRNEMLEILIEYYHGRETELFQMHIEADNHEGLGSKAVKVMEMNGKIKAVIEKATGKTWQEITGVI